MTPDTVVYAAGLIRDRRRTEEMGVFRPNRDEPSRMPSAEDQFESLLSDIHAMQAYGPALDALQAAVNQIKTARLNAIDDELRLLGVQC